MSQSQRTDTPSVEHAHAPEALSMLRSQLKGAQWMDPVWGGLARVPAREALPTATADLAGCLIFIPGTPDEMYFCGKNAGGTYGWRRMYLNDGDKGDITVSTDGTNWQLDADSVGATEIAANAVGASELADSAVDTAAIQDDAVTYAKIQNMTTSRILGRTTASSGNIEELTVSSPLTLGSGALGINMTQSHSLITASATAGGPGATTSETTCFSFTVVGGSMTTTSLIRIRAFGLFTSGTTGPDVTIRLYFDSTLIWEDVTAVIGTSEARAISLEILIMSNASTSAQIWGGLLVVGANDTAATGYGSLGTDEILTQSPIYATSSVNTASNKTLEVTAQLSSGVANNSFIIEGFIAELIG
jgi:hypothetical protein